MVGEQEDSVENHWAASSETWGHEEEFLLQPRLVEVARRDLLYRRPPLKGDGSRRTPTVVEKQVE